MGPTRGSTSAALRGATEATFGGRWLRHDQRGTLRLTLCRYLGGYLGRTPYLVDKEESSSVVGIPMVEFKGGFMSSTLAKVGLMVDSLVGYCGYLWYGGLQDRVPPH